MHPLTQVGIGYTVNTTLTFALGIGLSDIFLTSKIPDTVPGTGTSKDDTEHPVRTLLGGSLRSVGSSWRGYAVILWWISRDVENRTGPLAFLGTVMTLSGLVRLTAVLTFHIADPFILTATAAEVAAPFLVYTSLAPLPGWSSK